MSLLLISFLAWILSVLAPCVLPVLPVIFGWSGTDLQMGKALRILWSALVFIFVFTFLLKVSTAFIWISTQTRAMISWGIILLYGCTIVFPLLRERLQTKFPSRWTNNTKQWARWDILLWASLWPIFTSCSPTYTLLLATILPQSITQWILWILAYLLWFWWFLYILLRGWRVLIKQFMSFADSQGWFKKLLWWILIATWILIISWWMKKIETRMVMHLPNSIFLEEQLLQAVQPKENTLKNPLSSSQNTMHNGYQEYNPNTIPLSWDIVLFFHADRCPTCNEAEKNFLETGVPEWLTILKVNYDTETELKKKYGILTQTSYVLIQPDGTMIKRRIWWRTLEELQSKIEEAKEQSPQPTRTPSWTTTTAYLAWWCFRCMEWPLEALPGVKEVISGYAWWDKSTASYKLVGRWDTGHREAVKVVYDPGLVSYAEILATYRTQIDPTDGWWQFGDRGFQYSPVIYWQTAEEQEIAKLSKQRLEESKTFDEPIAVEIIPFTTFFDAEEEHQDFYKKESDYYKSYKKWSGRAGFIESNETNVKKIFENKSATLDLSHLTEQQKDILFNWGTEPPFNNAYRDHKEAWIYVDVIDGTPLFSSLDKFDSGTWWPAFTRPIDEALVSTHTDNKLRVERTEIKSATSNGHLGHVFDDWPQDKWWKRYCINSAALRFVALEDMKTPQYEKYLVLFQ